MWLTYQPQGQEAQHFEYLPGRIGLKRAHLLEMHYKRLAGRDKTWDQLKLDAEKGAAMARLVLLWHFLSLQHPMLRIEDLDPADGDLKLNYSKEEWAEQRAEVEKLNAPEVEKLALLAVFDVEIANARPHQGKAPSAETSSPGAGEGASATSPTRSGSRSANSSAASARASRKKN